MKIKNIVAVSMMALSLAACSKVKPGNVGVKVNTLGDNKGVDNSPLGVGWYWVGWTEDLYQFPIFQQTYQWTRENNEAITFQSSDGVAINGEFAITYHIDPEMVPKVFQTYRRGVTEITNGPIRNAVRDDLQKYASSLTSEEAYSSKKNWLIEQVTNDLQKQFGPIGIQIESFSLLSSLELPDDLVRAINAKIVAYQQAESKHNEVATERAQQEINRVKAEGEAAAAIARANGVAQSNLTISKSLTPELIQFEMIQKWNGRMPQVSGTSGISTLIPLLKEK